MCAAICFSAVDQVNAQAKRYGLFEHFTQASCGPCAFQNPAFFSAIENNTDKVHVIAYHTSWPGVDPMYSHNTAENAAATSNYNISGVPNSVFNGENLGVSNSFIDDFDNVIKVGSSPYRLLVTEEVDMANPEMVNGQVRVVSADTPFEGDVRLKLAIVERSVVYSSPPGSNGELDFKYVFRKYVNGEPGQVITPAPTAGDEIAIDFSYEYDSEWEKDQIFTIAYLTTTDEREVLQSGIMGDPTFEIAGTTYDFAQTTDLDNGNNFRIVITELGNESSEVKLTLSSDQPSDWSASMSFDGVDLGSEGTIDISSGTNLVSINVMPGMETGIGYYTITAEQLGTGLTETFEYILLTPYTDLVITNSFDFVDPAYENDIETPYVKGLRATGNNLVGALTDQMWDRLYNEGVFDAVEHIYYSAGWTEQAFADGLSDQLTAFVENGGNVMIAGQDLANELGNTGAPLEDRLFLVTKMNAKFVENGTSSMSEVYTIDSDPLVTNIADFNINESIYEDETSPDVIEPRDSESKLFLEYSGNLGAGVRYSDTYKAVTLGFGMEQIENEDTRDQLMGVIHDWFHGNLTSVEFDLLIDNLNVSAFPNPAQSFVTIDFKNVPLEEGITINVQNHLGQNIATYNVDKGSKQYEMNIQNLDNGVYYYQLSDGQRATKAKKLVVLK